jgi:uncharacterized membrane protein YjdF
VIADDYAFDRLAGFSRRLKSVARAIWRKSPRSQGVLLSTVGLGGLLAFLLIHEAIRPNFTDYWGYMIGQIAVTLAVIVALDVYFAREGGLSWYTHLVVTANTWADTFGTAAHLYERHSSYDKVTHFCAGIAITVAAADVLRGLDERGVLRRPLVWRLVAAMTITLALNIGWETYEYLGDVVFQSGRHQGSLDTTYDFVSDMTGALVSVFLIWRVPSTRACESESETWTTPAFAELAGSGCHLAVQDTVVESQS